jgi:hypothetical protein
MTKPDVLEVGVFVLYDDPGELDRVARALGLPR